MAIGGLNLVEAELRSPFQQAELPGPGLDLAAGIGGAIETGLGAQKAFKAQAKAEAFEQLLKTGQEGMIRMAESLVEEGSLEPNDIAKLNPNDAAFQGADGQLLWYQGIDKIVKEKAAAKEKVVQQERTIQAFGTEGTRDQRIEALVKGGAKATQIQKQFTGEEKAALEEMANTKLQEFITEANIPTSATEDQLVQVVLDFTEANPQFASTDAFKEIRGALEGRLDRESKERAASQRLKKGEAINFRKFLSEVNKQSPVVTAINKVDAAIPGGIDNPSGDAFGVVGFGTKKFRKFINSDEGVKLRQAVNNFFLAKIKAQSGVAVSDKEFERVESGFGLNTTGTVKSFISSMVITRDENLQLLTNLEALLTPEQLEDARQRGVTTTESLAQPDKEKGETKTIGKFKIRVIK